MVAKFYHSAALACVMLIWGGNREVATAQVDLPRVGNELDPYELAYFGLFPLARGAVSGRVEKGAGGAVAVLNLANGEERRVPLSEAQLAALAEGLRTYEACEQGEFAQREASYEERLRQLEAGQKTTLQGVLFCHDRLRKGSFTRLHRSEAPPVEGELLYADERGIAVWAGQGGFDWSRPDRLRVLSWPEVMAFRVDRSLTWSVTGRILPAAAIGGAGWVLGGAQVAGGQDAGPAVLAAVVSGLAAASAMRRPLGGDQWEGWTGGEPEAGQDLAIQLGKQGAMAFGSTPAPEVMAALDGARSRPVGSREPAEPWGRGRWSRRLHVSAGAARVGLGAGQAPGVVHTGFTRASIVGRLADQQAAYYGDASFSWSRRLRTGASGRLRNRTAPGEWEVAYSDWGLALFAEYVVVARKQRGWAPWERLELAIALGGGVAETAMSVRQIFPYFVQANADVPRERELDSSARGVSPYARAAAGFYVSESLSLKASVAYRGMPEATTLAAIGPTPSSLFAPVYEYEEATAQPSPLEVFLGIGWHLW